MGRSQLHSKESVIMDIESTYTSAVEKARESTVSVRTAAVMYGHPFGPFPARGVGSGVVLDKEGHVLTNEHVVSGADDLVVALPDGRVLGGTIVGSDVETDIAVLETEPGLLSAAEFGNSDVLKIGQPVLALGSPLGLMGGPTVTSGVISALTRSIHLGNGEGLQVIQTDAAVNRGSSGGPLVDLNGRVVAITTAHVPFADGIGFAIPSNTALKIAQEIVSHGRVVRPWLGIMGYEVSPRMASYHRLPRSTGILITALVKHGPALGAGLRVGDMLVAAGGRQVASMADLSAVMKGLGPGESVELEVIRNGANLKSKVQLGTRPN
jgi:serine protease Do